MSRRQYQGHGSQQRQGVDVYVDGSCRGNGQQGAKAGVGVYFGEGSSMNYSGPLEGSSRPTNNNAEIQAATRACEIARQNGIRNLNIHSDSNHLIKSTNEWMPKWQQNGWTTSSGTPVANREQLERFVEAKRGMDVTLTHVPAHSNVHGNEMADRLANEGASRY